ncbi:MAG: D-(-)-3-hydroxybutyrate oligomer hydrolase [Acetobacteraceae bacterium]|nr:D-(-)-3-hydroxybutyrate oligomer hydrolase [Acetobacteraceae bacterium]
MPKKSSLPLAAVIVLGCLPGPALASQLGERPALIGQEIVRIHYDGVSNDLLTAGLGKSGLQKGASPPSFKDPRNPTADELRRLAIFTNYQAIVDTSAGGGYGMLFGPNVGPDGRASAGEGLIAGDEIVAFARSSNGKTNVTMVVQIPDSYAPAHGCIIAAPSSGSRGIYGAIGTAGEWGLKHGCAVAYTDKGTGTGAYDLQDNTVSLLRGERQDAAQAGNRSNFTVPLSDADRDQFNGRIPNRFAFKHAHSQSNPEADWGQDVLDSIQVAFYALNQKFAAPGSGGRAINKRNTIVIASSISNGGGSSLRAAEQDRLGLIDGVAVSEPNVNPMPSDRFVIMQDGRPPVAQHSRPLIDYMTLGNLYLGCASAAPSLASAPLNTAPSPERCAALHRLGLLNSESVTEQAAEAQTILNDAGILIEQNLIAPSHWFLYVPQSIAMTYANAYGRFSVTDNLCGYSFAATGQDRQPMPLDKGREAALFGTSSGIPPTGGVDMVNNLAQGGAKEDRASSADQNLQGALCLRALAVGAAPGGGGPLAGEQIAEAQRIADGVRQIRASGDLHGLPAIIVTGRSDAVLPPNFTSRAYFGLNQLIEGARSQLRYYEITNAQHLDFLAGLPGFDAMLIPLQPYLFQALDLMYAHLRNATPLPPSQVVHTTPRGQQPDGKVPALAAANVPAIKSDPLPGERIRFNGRAVLIPN